MKIASFEMVRDLCNNFYIHIFMFSSCVSAPKLEASWEKERQAFIHPCIHLRAQHNAFHLAGIHRRLSQGHLRFKKKKKKKGIATFLVRSKDRLHGMMWSLPAFPCHMSGSPEGKMAFIFHSDCWAIQKSCLDFIRDEMLISRN